MGRRRGSGERLREEIGLRKIRRTRTVEHSLLNNLKHTDTKVGNKDLVLERDNEATNIGSGKKGGGFNDAISAIEE